MSFDFNNEFGVETDESGGSEVSMKWTINRDEGVSWTEKDDPLRSFEWRLILIQYTLQFRDTLKILQIIS